MVRVTIKSSDILFSRCLYFTDICFFVMICHVFCVWVYIWQHLGCWVKAMWRVFPHKKCYCAETVFVDTALFLNPPTFLYHLSSFYTVDSKPTRWLAICQKIFPWIFSSCHVHKATNNKRQSRTHLYGNVVGFNSLNTFFHLWESVLELKTSNVHPTFRSNVATT